MSSAEERRWLTELYEAQLAGGYASDHLARFFGRHRGLAPEARAQLAARYYELVRQSRRLCFALESEASDPSAVVALFLELSERPGGEALAWSRPGVDWARARLRFDTLPGLACDRERWALRRNLTEAAAAAILEGLGPDAEAFLEASGNSPPRTIRANRLRGSREELSERMLEEGFRLAPTSWSQDGLVVLEGPDLFRSPSFQEGWFEAQDEGSQLVAELVAPPPGGFVIDACAGAGGKTLAIASQLKGRGRIVALDIHEHKLVELRRRARRAGASNVQAICIEPEGALPEPVLEALAKADRILVDAPCSGLGVLRRNPEAGARLERDDLLRLPRIQQEIGARFASHLKPGARLVYATCTVLPGENQEIVRALRATDSALEEARVSEILGGERARPISDPQGRTLMLRPDLHGTDAFFASVLRRVRAPRTH